MGQMDRGGVITTARLSTACWLFIASYLLTESDGKISDQGRALVNNKVNNKAWDFLVKIERSRLIDPWVLRENNALELASQSAR